MNRESKRAAPAKTHRNTPQVSPLWLPVALAAGCILMFLARSGSHHASSLTVNRISINGAQVTLSQAAEMRDDQLARFDLAQLNLLASEGLPGCEGQDVEKLLTQLDTWTQQVRIETERNLHRFREHPEEYERSEAYYRMGMLITVLQQDFGVRYNPNLIKPSEKATPETDKDFLTNCANVFLTGILRDRIGTCASMPTLYVVVGKRLGYPVKLVSVKDHLFVRWEDQKERRNIEGTSQGIVCRSDTDYAEWRKVPEVQIKAGWQLRSLNPREELAVFLLTRAGALRFHKRNNDAIVAYAQAHRLWPENPDFKVRLADSVVEAVPAYFHPHPSPGTQALRPRGPFESLREVNALNRQRSP